VYHDLQYTRPMARAISVRLDEESDGALRAIEATGLCQSDAIRVALVQTASALRRPLALSAEKAALEADEVDRREMLAVADLMESLRAEG